MSDAGDLREAITRAGAGLVDRATIAETLVLCAVAGEHLLVVGPPGTAKSQAVRRMADMLGGSYFEYLLGRFTEPNELFGPVDLRRLRDGVVEFETAGMLPEAEVAFLDEVFLGSTAILNTLLGLLNERTFRRGRTVVSSPLRVCVGAANVLPDEPALAAFADRFLARVFVEPVEDARLEELLESGWAARLDPQPPARRLVDALDHLADAAARCDLDAVRPTLAVALRRMRAGGIAVSDRRAIRMQRLIAAAAVLDGRDAGTTADLWVLPLIAPTADTQQLARQLLSDLLRDASNDGLAHSAAELSQGPRARAARLRRVGAQLLVSLGSSEPGPDDRLRIEATLREIDATVAAEDLGEELTAVRADLAALLAP